MSPAYAHSGDTYKIIDYHLLSGSGAINAGTTQRVRPPRISRAKPAALLTNIGVDEYVKIWFVNAATLLPAPRRYPRGPMPIPSLPGGTYRRQ